MTRPLGPPADGWTLDTAAPHSTAAAHSTVRGAVHDVANTTLTPDGARQLARRLLAGAADAV